MSGWFWAIAGIALLVLEVCVPVGFFFFLLGGAALLVSAGVFLMILPGLNLQLLAFALLAILFPLGFRAKLKTLFPRKLMSGGGETVGQIVVVKENIAPSSLGSGELWGSPWRVKNVDTEALEAGSQAIVTGSEGITLLVKRK
jgi:membrane protein implicated in regulation of membrane protease activity